MLRIAGRRISSSLSGRPNHTSAAIVSRNLINGGETTTTTCDDDFFSSKKSFYLGSIRGFASESLAPKQDRTPELPATVAAVKNPTPKIVYDNYNHERYPPGDPSKRAFAYFVLTGGKICVCFSCPITGPQVCA